VQLMILILNMHVIEKLLKLYSGKQTDRQKRYFSP
jgi:hypothetical protein